MKRHPAIVEFSKDHHFALLLVWKLRQGIQKAVEGVHMGAYIEAFFQHSLSAHFSAEESLLFVHLKAEDTLRVRAEKEHAEIRAMMREVHAGAIQTDFIAQYADALEAHVRFEERELFPRLEKVCSPEVLLSIAKAMQSGEHQREMSWNDPFWE